MWWLYKAELGKRISVYIGDLGDYTRPQMNTRQWNWRGTIRRLVDSRMMAIFDMKHTIMRQKSEGSVCNSNWMKSCCFLSVPEPFCVDLILSSLVSHLSFASTVAMIVDQREPIKPPTHRRLIQSDAPLRNATQTPDLNCIFKVYSESRLCRWFVGLSRSLHFHWCLLEPSLGPMYRRCLRGSQLEQQQNHRIAGGHASLMLLRTETRSTGFGRIEHAHSKAQFDKWL